MLYVFLVYVGTDNAGVHVGSGEIDSIWLNSACLTSAVCSSVAELSGEVLVYDEEWFVEEE